jgi:hypothetical protein
MIGAQEPRISLIPPCVSSAGDEAVDLARMAGLHLDPWEADVLRASLGEVPHKHPWKPGAGDTQWAAFMVGLCVPRQNGKDAIIEARELAGLFLFGEELIIHSAHEFATSAEHFRRLAMRIENTPEFSRRLKGGKRGIRRSHGEEGIELVGGQRIRFKTRTKGSGLGFSCDLLIWNEAMHLAEDAVAATMPTISARPNSQIWVAGSPVDRERHDHGVAFARVRERAISGEDDSLAYFEWSADADLTDAPLVANDPDAWASANPGLGIRITLDHIAREQRSMDPRTFAVERLGIGDWPNTDGSVEQVIDPYVWAQLEDQNSSIKGTPAFAVDVAPDRSSSTISAAGWTPDGHLHVETVDRNRGTGWLVGRLEQVLGRHAGEANPRVVLDPSSPAGSLITSFEEVGIRVDQVTAREYAQACGGFFDAVDNRELRHLNTPELLAAVRGAVKRPLGEAWAWDRKNTHVDISPLVAATLALREARINARSAEPVVVFA